MKSFSLWNFIIFIGLSVFFTALLFNSYDLYCLKNKVKFIENRDFQVQQLEKKDKGN